MILIFLESGIYLWLVQTGCDTFRIKKTSFQIKNYEVLGTMILHKILTADSWKVNGKRLFHPLKIYELKKSHFYSIQLNHDIHIKSDL